MLESLMKLIPYSKIKSSSTLLEEVLQIQRKLNARVKKSNKKNDNEEARLACCLEYIARKEGIGQICLNTLANTIGMSPKNFKTLHTKMSSYLKELLPDTYASPNDIINTLAISLGEYIDHGFNITDRASLFFIEIENMIKTEKEIHRKQAEVKTWRLNERAHAAACFYLIAASKRKVRIKEYEAKAMLEKHHVIMAAKLGEQEFENAISFVKEYLSILEKDPRKRKLDESDFTNRKRHAVNAIEPIESNVPGTVENKQSKRKLFDSDSPSQKRHAASVVSPEISSSSDFASDCSSTKSTPSFSSSIIEVPHNKEQINETKSGKNIKNFAFKNKNYEKRKNEIITKLMQEAKRKHGDISDAQALILAADDLFSKL